MRQFLSAGLGGWDLALLAVRLACGIGSFVHGKNKLGKVHLFAADHHLPVWLAWVATVVQIVGGIALVVGFATSIAAAALTIFYVWATYELIVRKKEPFAAPGKHTWDAGVMYTVTALAVLLAGPGRYSIDRALLGG